MSWRAASSLSDSELLAMRGRCADRCVSIVQMPVEERSKARTEKGGCSPDEFGSFVALAALMLDREVQRRGLEPAESAL